MAPRKKVTKNQQTIELAMIHYPHFKKYVDEFTKTHPMPKYVLKLEYKMKGDKDLNIIYPVGDLLFVHVYKPKGEPPQYIIIEPLMDKHTEKINDKILERMVEIAHELPVPDKSEEIGPVLIKILNKLVIIGSEQPGNLLKAKLSNKILLTEEQYEIVKYFILRNRVGYSRLEPLFNDPYIEDIHCTGLGNIKLIHKIFDMLRTNLEFNDDLLLNKYILETSERVERPVSDSHPVVDAVMPDGSRVNFIYGREVSREGSSFTIRKFSEIPVSIIEIINFHTMSPQIAAYIWLCLENGMNIFVCGETASGKTTTLNATAAFIKPDDKVYTVENTAEVTMPQDTWQHLVTREAGKDTDVTLFDLLIAALRSRPNYIIVGEIRGIEGNIAFQAMQCVRDAQLIIPGKGLTPLSTIYEQTEQKKQTKGKTQAVCELPVLVSEADGKIQQSTTTHVYKMDKQQLVNIHLDTGELLEVTPKHRFITQDKQEVTAQELMRGARPDILLPKAITWKGDSELHALLVGKRVRKDSYYETAIRQLDTTRARKLPYSTRKSSKTISYETYKEVVNTTPQMVELVRKGAIKTIRVPKTPSKKLLKDIARYLVGMPVETQNHNIITHVLEMRSTSAGKLFELDKKHLETIFEHLLVLTKQKKKSISDKLWYSIGRLAGDDSLYLTSNGKGKPKDYRWQIKNANYDEGYLYAQQAKKNIPHRAKKITTTQKGKTYTTRICNIDRSFIDFLTKKGFIWTEQGRYSKAVKKYVPHKEIGNHYAYIAGWLDSDCGIRYNSQSRTHEVYLALNVDSNHPQLLQDQLRYIKTYESELFPHVRCVEFRYHPDKENEVQTHRKMCEEIGFKVRTTPYQKSKGVGARVEFSANKQQTVFSTWRHYVQPYMHRKDKKKILCALGSTPNKKTKEHIITYQESTAQANKKLLPSLALLARISGHTLVTESTHHFEKLNYCFKKTATTKILRVEKGVIDHTYDLSMRKGTYYLGGNITMQYLYDTGHPVMSTFHAGSVHSMIQRLTGHPIDVPIAFIDNLNVVLIQMATSVNGRFVRRIMSVSEIERYYDVENKVISRRVFNWDPYSDEHRFSGYYNSFILEKKIAPKIGLADSKEIYVELEKRASILKKMQELNITNYYEVYKIIKTFHTEGVEGLPFQL